MQEKLIPVESDVNQYLNSSRKMFDFWISDLFKKYKIFPLLSYCNFKKRCGHPINKIFYELFLIPFIGVTNVHLFLKAQFQEAKSNKNRLYRFLENAAYNWNLFILNLSFIMSKEITSKSTKPLFYVIDDTICKLSGKLVEYASYIYDHISGKSVLGYQKLVLGIFNGSHFLPIRSSICVGKRKPNAKSKSIKYKKVPKSERIPTDSQGARERAEINESKLKKTIKMLKVAQRKRFGASYVLFDSWFCFNSFIKQIVDLKLHVICQLKNLPRANKYLYKGKLYSLKELFAYYGKSKLRTMKKYQYRHSTMTVGISNSDIFLKIVFVQNEEAEKWHAFASTDKKLSAAKILEYYSQRWSIEVFFKNCKQYLNFGKEQMSNFDSRIACDALVYTRYIILTYLAFKDNSGFTGTFDKVLGEQREKTFGARLLLFFLNKWLYIYKEVRKLIAEGVNSKAIELLDMFMEFSGNFYKVEPDLK